MAIFQAYNRKNKSYVKYEITENNKFKVLDVKQKESSKPFKNISIKGQKK